jgi:hypothetical protein
MSMKLTMGDGARELGISFRQMKRVWRLFNSRLGYLRSYDRSSIVRSKIKLEIGWIAEVVKQITGN